MSEEQFQSIIADRDEIILCCTNSTYLLLHENMYESLRRVGLDSQLVTACLDDESHEKCKGVTFRCDFIPCESIADRYLAKVRLIHRILQAGKRVLLTDVDIVFLKDPMLYLREKAKDHDIVCQNTMIQTINTGFYYANPESVDFFNIDDDPEEIKAQVYGPLWDQRLIISRIPKFPDVKIFKLPIDLFATRRFNDKHTVQNDLFIVHFTGRNKIGDMRNLGYWLLGNEKLEEAKRTFRWWRDQGQAEEPRGYKQDWIDRLKDKKMGRRPKRRRGRQGMGLVRPKKERPLFFVRQDITGELGPMRFISVAEPGTDKRVLDMQKQVFKKFGHDIEQIEDDYSRVNNILREMSDGHVVLFTPDVIPLNEEALKVLYNNIKHNVVTGITQQSKCRQHRRPFAGDGMVGFSIEVFNELDQPNLMATSELDSCQSMSRLIEQSNVETLLLLWKPTSCLYPRWGLHVRYGIGTIYEEMVYRTFEIWKPRYIPFFLDKCKEVLNG